MNNIFIVVTKDLVVKENNSGIKDILEGALKS